MADPLQFGCKLAAIAGKSIGGLCGGFGNPQSHGMIEYDRFIYLDVYRTGSSQILKLLPQLTGKKPVRFFRHASLTKAHPLGFTGGKLVFATVRNPWDWYVSLWAHGADGKSAIRRYLTARLAGAEVERLYDRADPATSFRLWLSAISDPVLLDRIMEEHMPQSGLAPVMGLYSYRFLRVTTRFPRLLLRSAFIRRPGDALRHLQRFKAYGEVLHTEALDAEFALLVARHGARLGLVADAAERLHAAAGVRANASTRSLSSYRDYYDAASARLVADRDPLFAEAFGYSF
jgi:hypothetical protein